MCSKDRFKAFSFLQSILSTEELIGYLTKPNSKDRTPIEYAVRFCSISCIKLIFDIQFSQSKTSNVFGFTLAHFRPQSFSYD